MLRIRPTAIILSGILNFVADDAEAQAVVDQLLGAVPSGSYLLISHPTTEVNGEAVKESMRQWSPRKNPRISSGVRALIGAAPLSFHYLVAETWRSERAL